MDKPTILLVEDEAPIRKGLCDHLQRSGFIVRAAADLAGARQLLEQPADLLVLDRRLPDGDGLEALQELRQGGNRMPVIVLSALGETEQRIAGLEIGADDYLAKPFDLRELVARIRAVLQRGAQDGDRRHLDFGTCRLDLAARQLLRSGEAVELSRMEFELLQYLCRHAGRAIPRRELLDEVWGYERFPTTRTIDFHVLRLRKKIELEPQQPRHIVTVHRVGYRFDP